MNEQVLLRIALFIAISGVLTLFVIDELPASTQYGTLTWTNHTTGLLVYEESVWLEANHPIILDTPQCVAVSGIVTQGRITNANIGATSSMNCP